MSDPAPAASADPAPDPKRIVIAGVDVTAYVRDLVAAAPPLPPSTQTLLTNLRLPVSKREDAA